MCSSQCPSREQLEQSQAPCSVSKRQTQPRRPHWIHGPGSSCDRVPANGGAHTITASSATAAMRYMQCHAQCVAQSPRIVSRNHSIPCGSVSLANHGRAGSMAMSPSLARSSISSLSLPPLNSKPSESSSSLSSDIKGCTTTRQGSAAGAALRCAAS